MSKFKKGAIATAIVVGLVVVGGFMSYTKVMPGHAGLVYNLNGGIESTTLSQGGHFVAPWKKVIQYPTSTETVALIKDSKGDDSFNVSTREGKQVNLDTRYSYHIDATKLPDVFTKFRGADSTSVENGYMKTALQSAVQAITTQYGVLDIYGSKRDEITAKVEKKFKEVLAPDGIIVESFSFGEIRPDETTLLAIQENVNAQQKLQTLEVQKQQAQAEADRLKIEAQGKADAALIEAEGQAKANEVLKQSLTTELVQKAWVDKWNGQMPTVQSDGGTLVQIPDITSTDKK